MPQTPEGQSRSRYCKACGTPAGRGTLCERCGSVLETPEGRGLTEDQGAAVRRDFEDRRP